MTSYKIVFKNSVKKDFKRISNKREIERILDAIQSLGHAPRPVGVIKLKVQGEPYWRIRIGDYRVIYEIRDSEKVISILAVGHRKDIYQKID